MSIRGQTVAVIAPAGVVHPEKLEAGLTFLRGLGASPELGPHLYDQHGYLAGTKANRLADLKWALTTPGINWVWFARGGSGTAQLVDLLPWDQIKNDRKVVGYSDATALLLSLTKLGISSIHGPVLTSFANEKHPLDDSSLHALISLLESHCPTNLTGMPFCGPDRSVEGKLIGGNLAVLASLCGTSYQLCGQGEILLLEDVGEAPYRVERLLYQLISAGCFKGVNGIALGEFLDCGPPAGSERTVFDVFREHLEPLGIPVIQGIPVGHGGRNVAFPYGEWVRLDSSGIVFL